MLLLLHIEIVTGQLLQVGMLLLLLLLLQHVSLAIVVLLQVWLHLIETNAAATEEIWGRILPIAVVQRKMRAMLSGGGVADQQGSRQMTVPVLVMVMDLLLVLLLVWMLLRMLLRMRFTYEEDNDARNGCRCRAYVIARSAVFERVIVQKRGEWNAYQHRN